MTKATNAQAKEAKAKANAFKAVVYTDKDIDRHIGGIEKDAKSLRDKIHNLAVSILKIWHDAKDSEAAALLAVERINRLQNASPYHTKAFSKWVGTIEPLMWSDENKSWYLHLSNVRLMGKQFIAARDKPFWIVSPPSSAKPFLMWDEINRIIDRAQKHSEKPVAGDVIDPAIIRQLRSIAELAKAK